jgi:3-oxoacyl-[acyl-carrier protein] reductase
LLTGAWLSAVNLMLMSTVRLIRCAPSAEIFRGFALTITSVSVKQPITSLLLSNSVRLAVIGLTKPGPGIGWHRHPLHSILPASTETDASPN